MRKTYTETFDNGPGGWLLWLAGGGGPLPPDIRDGALVSRSPWGIDFNHAPPGAGYCHLLYCLGLFRKDKFPYEKFEPYIGKNRFVEGNYSTNLTNAKITVRVRGEVDLQGANLMLLVQGDVGPIRTNWVLDSQPIKITKDWTEQTITLVPDESKWTCMGVRTSGADCDFYGTASLAKMLEDVTINIIFVLFPLNVRPWNIKPGADPHQLRAGKDYSVDRRFLPNGEVWLDSVKIEYPD